MGLSRTTLPSVPRLAKIPTLGYQPTILFPLDKLQKGDVLLYSLNSRSTPWRVEQAINKSGNVLVCSLLSGNYRKINAKILRKNKVYKVVRQ